MRLFPWSKTEAQKAAEALLGEAEAQTEISTWLKNQAALVDGGGLFPIRAGQSPNSDTGIGAPGPVYYDRFEDICREMVALHNKKGADYGAVNDPYANVRASEEFGVPPWVGALIRLNDKITRLKSYIRNGGLANESAQDSIQDIAVYAVIVRILFDEAQGLGAVVDPRVADMLDPKNVGELFGYPSEMAEDPYPTSGVIAELHDAVVAFADSAPELSADICFCDLEPAAHEPHIIRFVGGAPVLSRQTPPNSGLEGRLEAVRALDETEYNERMAAVGAAPDAEEPA